MSKQNMGPIGIAIGASVAAAFVAFFGRRGAKDAKDAALIAAKDAKRIMGYIIKGTIIALPLMVLKNILKP